MQECPTGKPWQIWPQEMSGPTCTSVEPFPWCLHHAIALLPAQLSPLGSRVQAVYRYQQLYLHGIVTLVLIGSALMWDVVIKFATLNCPNLTLGHPGLWSICVAALSSPCLGSLGCVRTAASVGLGVLLNTFIRDRVCPSGSESGK